MENSAQSEKLKKYTFTDKVYYTGFDNYEEAEDYASQVGGKLVEVLFKDANDNPELSTEGQLLEKKLHYFADAGPDFKFLHSGDEAFQDFAANLQEAEAEIKEESPEERFIAKGEIELQEDPIIILKNGKFHSVTSREGSKYFDMTNVYELAVERPVKVGDDIPEQ